MYFTTTVPIIVYICKGFFPYHINTLTNRVVFCFMELYTCDTIVTFSIKESLWVWYVVLWFLYNRTKRPAEEWRWHCYRGRIPSRTGEKRLSTSRRFYSGSGVGTSGSCQSSTWRICTCRKWRRRSFHSKIEIVWFKITFTTVYDAFTALNSFNKALI